MTTFFTSDTHYFHKNVIKYSNRPFASVDEMNEELVARWNKKVRPGDTVWHLGDVSFSGIEPTKAVLVRLNGIKRLLFGNHDRNLKKHLSVIGPMFESIGNYKEINIEGQDIILSHYPMLEWNKGHHGSWMLHGHCHGNARYTGNYRIIDVGVDVQGYAPVSFEELQEQMKGKEDAPHHDR